MVRVKLAFHRQGRAPVSSSLKITRIVVWVGSVVVAFRIAILFLEEFEVSV